MVFTSYAEGKEKLSGITLVSCGHIFANPNREIYRPNGRDDWLLFYVAKEEETFFLDKTMTAKMGSFMLYAPGEKQHHAYTGTKTAEFYYVHFRCDALPSDIALESSRIYSLSPRKVFSETFEEIIEETLQKKPHYEALSISRLLYLLSLIKREISEGDNSLKGRWKSVAPAIQHINKFCDSNLKLEDYSEMCCMSKYHFSRVFKEATGFTPIEYRNGIRIEHAKELLKSSYLSISEIAESLGYTSAAYFSSAFKREIGMPPVEYREGKR